MNTVNVQTKKNRTMKLELNFYKSTGKWYTTQITECVDLSDIEKYPYHPDMDYTVHIVESDGFLQPYRMFKR